MLVSVELCSDSVLVFLGGISWNVVTGLLFFVENVLGSSVRSFELSLESLVLLGSSSLLGSSGLGSLGLDGSSSGVVSLGLSLLVELGSLGSEWVQSVHDGLVVEWVLLGLVMNSHGSSNFSKLGLNLVGVDDSGEISAGHEISVEGVSGLLDGVSEVGSEKKVESLESRSGENNKSSEVTSWGELDDVKSINMD